jgi:hypothetical protein
MKTSNSLKTNSLSHPEFIEGAKGVILSLSKGACVAVLLFLSQLGYAQSEPSLLVGLRNGKVLYPNTLDYVSKTFGTDHLVVNDTTMYPIREVKYYQDETGYYVWTSIGGFGGETKLRREIDGKVKTFTGFQSTYTPGMYTGGMYTGGMHSTKKLQYFQKGNGLIKKVSYENLQYDLKDSQPSMAKLGEVKKMRDGATAAYVLSGAVLLGGLIHTAKLNEQEGPPPYEATLKISPAFFVGVIGLAIPSFTKNSREEKLIKAIKIYNQN